MNNRYKMTDVEAFDSTFIKNLNIESELDLRENEDENISYANQKQINPLMLDNSYLNSIIFPESFIISNYSPVNDFISPYYGLFAKPYIQNIIDEEDYYCQNRGKDILLDQEKNKIMKDLQDTCPKHFSTKIFDLIKEDKNPPKIKISNTIDYAKTDIIQKQEDLIPKEIKFIVNKRNPNRKLYCNICNKTFEKPQQLGGHMSKHHRHKSMKYQMKMEIYNKRKKIRDAINDAKKVVCINNGINYNEYLKLGKKKEINFLLKTKFNKLYRETIDKIKVERQIKPDSIYDNI